MNATYEVVEGDDLITYFQLNVKGETTLGNVSVSGTITEVAGDNTSKFHYNTEE